MQVSAVVLLAILQIRLDLMIPEFMRRITILTQTSGSTVNDVLVAGLMMLLAAFGSLACVFIISFLASKTSAALSMRLRDMLFAKICDFSMEEISRFSTSSLISRTTNDITQVQQFTMSALQMLLRIPILAVGGIIGIAGTGLAWTVSALIAFAFVLIVILCAMIAVMPQFKKMQNLVDRLNHNVRESLTGRHVVRAYNAEEFHEARFEQANSAFTSADRKTNRVMAVMSPAMSLGTNGVLIAAYVVGAFVISTADHMQALNLFSSMVVMIFYLNLLFTATKFITKIAPRMPRATVSIARINEVLETEPIIKEGTLTQGVEGKRGEIIFNDVCFTYPRASEKSLDNISFTAKQGETVAIIGSTGSGKTTLINLVMRFFDVTEGEIFINGVNIKSFKTEALNNIIGYVPQKSTLLQGTILNNVAYGDNGKGGYTRSDVKHALQIAKAEEFVKGMEGGVDAVISQRGANLSGGQKQRLSIARAVCRNPEILVFDDSFSALDFKTDRELRTALKNNANGVTKFVVAQRIATIMDADQIVVLDDGKIAGVGTHHELLHTCLVYKEIAMSQLSEEELAS